MRRSLVTSLGFLLITSIRVFSAEIVFEPIASHGVYELYIDESTTQVMVRNRETGAEWRSNPPLEPDARIPAGIWGSALIYPVILNHTYVWRQTLVTVDLQKAQLETNIRATSDGAAVDYRVTIETERVKGESLKGSISFGIRYSLTDDGLQVAVPESTITEEGSVHIVSLEVLPLFGANAMRDDGFLFVPDGMGMIVPFQEAASVHVYHTGKRIYGEEEFAFPVERQAFEDLSAEELIEQYRRFAGSEEKTRLPVFGLVAGNNGFLGIVTDGASNARINASLRGFVIDYNRIGVQLLYRTPSTIYLSRTKSAVMYDARRIRGDRVVRFLLTGGSDLTYADLALLYREYLVNSGTLRRAADVPWMDLRLFCGATEPHIFTERFVTTTRFDEAQSILSDLLDERVRDLSLTLVGWEAGGYLHDPQDKFPPERRLGGEPALRSIVETAGKDRVPVFLEAGYALGLSGTGNLTRRANAIRMASDLPFAGEDGHYLVSPEIVSRQIVPPDIRAYKDLGIQGIVLRHAGDTAISDYSDRRPLQRDESIHHWVSVGEQMREAGLSVHVTGGNAYFFDVADSVYGAPTVSSRLVNGGDEVPFYQMAVHGLLPYTGPRLNLSGDLRADILRIAELGARPCFELTYSDPIVLKDSGYQELYSSEYAVWRDVLIATYRELEPLRRLQGLLIADHERVKDGRMVVVTYEDGTRVVVNHGREDGAVDGRKIDARSFVVLGPAEGLE